jgi:hypothetical protein
MSIDDVMWRKARELAESPGGLEIEGLGTFHGGRFTDRRTSRPPTGYDAPKLVVATADATGAKDDDVRAQLRAAIKQALDSASGGRPAPLGGLGLLEERGGTLRFHPSRRSGTQAVPGAIDAALAAWRLPADDLGQRIAGLVTTLEAIDGVLSPADQRRLLDELDYDLDEGDWQRHGDRIIAALPF